MLSVGGTCCSVSGLSSIISKRKLSFPTEEESHVRRTFPCSASAKSLSSLYFIVSKGVLSLTLSAKRSLKGRGRVVVNVHNEDACEDGDPAGGTMQVTIEHSKKVLALQKELLQRE